MKRAHEQTPRWLVSQPKFLSKKQREELALKRREDEAALQKQK